jgi:hypothetical protein
MIKQKIYMIQDFNTGFFVKEKMDFVRDIYMNSNIQFAKKFYDEKKAKKYLREIKIYLNHNFKDYQLGIIEFHLSTSIIIEPIKKTNNLKDIDPLVSKKLLYQRIKGMPEFISVILCHSELYEEFDKLKNKLLMG